MNNVFHQYCIDLKRYGYPVVVAGLLLQFCGVSGLNAENGPSTEAARECVVAIAEAIRSIPDCAIKYNVFHEQKTGGYRKMRMRFAKSGVMWRREIRKSDGGLYKAWCFDGEKYYWYEPWHDYLAIAVNPEKFEPHVSMSFAENPLFARWFPIFANRYSDFYLPKISLTSTWSEHVASFDEVSIEDNGGKSQILMTGRDYECKLLMANKSDDRINPIKSLLQHKNPATGEKSEYWSDVRAKSPETFTIDSEELVVSMKIVSDGYYQNGKRLRSRDIIEVVPGSVRALPESTTAEAFRIPVSAVSRPYVIK